MREKISRVVAVVVVATGLSASAALAGDVSVGINIGTPAPVVVVPAPPVVVAPAPPAVVVPAPPQLVVVPGTSALYVPSVSFNLFHFGGFYYSFHNGYWFHSATYNGPWVTIAIGSVPPAVLAVPVAYYKIPPGHAKNQGGGPPAGHCPPGQAKKGRC